MSGYSLGKVVWEAALKQEQEVDRLTAALKDAERERDELRNEAVEAIRESERLHALNRDLERAKDRLGEALETIIELVPHVWSENDYEQAVNIAREALQEPVREVEPYLSDNPVTEGNR